ncbi:MULTISPECIES: CHAT domain-containing protein [unclassified Oceanobacillus]|uniref:CHAT domain-containing protein n=1 Tax=unclassified Oceanobacillus TaxID=2630292 RepID=UPI00300DCF24
MSLLNTYRNNVFRKGRELSRLQENKAKKIKDISDIEKRIKSAQNSIRRTKSESTIRTKQQSIDRDSNKLSSEYKKLAALEKDIVSKSKQLASEESKLQIAERKEREKTLREDEKRQKDLQQRMEGFNKTLVNQERVQTQIQSDITELKRLPEKITILFMTSSPVDQQQLRPDEEAREIEGMIRKSDMRDSIDFVTKWAARPLDVLQAINEVNPTIVHFSGHGSEGNELVFQDNDGNTKLVSKEAIVQTIVSTSDDVRLVFFSSCFSSGQAKEIVKHIDAAVGMKVEIGDDTARIFAAYFYSAIGFGHSISRAFQQAKSSLMLEDISEEDIPELYLNSNIMGDEMILVQS